MKLLSTFRNTNRETKFIFLSYLDHTKCLVKCFKYFVIRVSNQTNTYKFFYETRNTKQSVWLAQILDILKKIIRKFSQICDGQKIIRESCKPRHN